MERVRELAAGVRVREVPSTGGGGQQSAAWRDGGQQSAAGRGGTQLQAGFGTNTYHQPPPQLSMASSQGDGLLGAKPPGFSEQPSVGGIPNLLMQSSGVGGGNNAFGGRGGVKRTHVSEDRSQEMLLVKELAHRTEFLLKKPNIPLHQPWNFLNNAALKMSEKLDIEQFAVINEYQDEDGIRVNKRDNWIISVFLHDTKLITYEGQKGQLQKDCKTKAGEELINMLLNPRTLTLERGEKTSPKGRKYTSEVVSVPLPWLKDQVQDYKTAYQSKKTVSTHSTPSEPAPPIDPDNPFANFVLLEAPTVPELVRDLQVISNSAQVNKGSKLEITTSDTKIPVNGEEVWLAKIILNDSLIGFGTHTEQKKAKHVAAKVAVEFLRKKCPTVKHNRSFEVDQKSAIPVQHILADGGGSSALDSSARKAIGEGNVGHKMLKLMGWSGEGGLGKDGLGISQPIIPIEHIRREGLGFSEGGINRDAVTKICEDYIASGSLEPLVFPACLDRDERKQIHGVAHKLNLKSKSYGPKEGEDRYLLISRKRSVHQLVMDGAMAGGETGGYEVKLPSDFN